MSRSLSARLRYIGLLLVAGVGFSAYGIARGDSLGLIQTLLGYAFLFFVPKLILDAVLDAVRQGPPIVEREPPPGSEEG